MQVTFIGQISSLYKANHRDAVKDTYTRYAIMVGEEYNNIETILNSH